MQMGSNELCHVEMLWNYVAKSAPMTNGDIDISVPKGTILIALQKLSGWVRVDNRGVYGLVPDTFVKRVDVMEAVFGKQDSTFVMSTGERDIPFEKGVFMVLLENFPNGWSRIKMLPAGEIGVVPLSYLKKVVPTSNYKPNEEVRTIQRSGSNGQIGGKPKNATQPNVQDKLVSNLQSVLASKGKTTNQKSDSQQSTQVTSNVVVQKRESRPTNSEKTDPSTPVATESSPRVTRSISLDTKSEDKPSLKSPKIERSSSSDGTKELRVISIDKNDLLETESFDKEAEEIAKALQELDLVNRGLEEKRKRAAQERKKLEEELKREEEEHLAIVEEQEKLEILKKEIEKKQDKLKMDTLEKEQKNLEQQKKNTLRKHQVLTEHKEMEQVVETKATEEEEQLKKRKELIQDRKQKLLQRKKLLEDAKTKKSADSVKG